MKLVKHGKQWLAAGLALLLALSLAACGGNANNAAPPESESQEENAEETANAATSAMSEAEQALENQSDAEEIEIPDGIPAKGGKIYVQGYEWGPGVPKIIMELPVSAAELTGKDSDALAVTAGVVRNVTGVYFSDENGGALEDTMEGADYVTFELETTQTKSGSPFNYNTEIFMNQWSESYPVIACANVDGENYVLNADLINSRICPETEAFTDRDEFTGIYKNPMTGEDEEYTLRYAANAPEDLIQDGVKNPLIIWLHGQGEGGTDVDIELIGNEVVALNRDEIQSYFTTDGGADGAYVLAVQCETYWMDGGDGTNSGGDLISRYTEILMDTIQAYVESNPDVDENRIYLGGCSNGGYMTINMLVSYPDFWAAAYPNCEAYAWSVYEKDDDGEYVYNSDGGYIMTDERWMTDEKINAIKDIPIWFVNAYTDPVVTPQLFSMPTYRALLQAGAENAWYSMFDTVPGSDDPDAFYIGHFAWVYTFNNQVTGVQDRDAIQNGPEDENMGFNPTNDGGGTEKAVNPDGTEYNNLFAWMNAQNKA